MTSKCKSMVNAQYGRPLFLLTCEIRLHLSKFFCDSKHKNLLTIKQRYEIWALLVYRPIIYACKCCTLLRCEVSKLNCGKLLLFWKLRYFRGSCFSQCFTLSTALHYSLPSKLWTKNYVEKLPLVYTALMAREQYSGLSLLCHWCLFKCFP